MTNTQRYFNTIMRFRDDLRKLDEQYKPEYDRLERFKDSQYYASDKALIDQRRKAQVDGLRRETQERITAIVADMEKTYMERPSSAPSAEQLSLLQALKMRESIGKDELRAAANALKGCPVAEGVLEEISRKQGHPIIFSQSISGDAVRQHLQSLRNSADHLIANLEHPGERGAFLNRGDYGMFRLDVDPVDDADCMRIFGCVTDAQAFSDAVNAQTE